MKYSKAVTRLPGSNFSEGLTSVKDQPRADLVQALAQHAAYRAALSACGLEVTLMGADEKYPDGTFVEDTFVVAEGVAVATRPGASTRMGEVEAVALTLQRFRPDQHLIQAPGSVDGGDICQVENHFLLGLSARTNEAGASQLAAILEQHGFSSSTVDIRGSSTLLHLKSGIAYLGDERFVVAPGFPTINAFAEFERIEVTSEETYGANCVRINDVVLIAYGHPKLESALTKRGYRVESLQMSEFAKMDGGLSCLSLRF